VGERDVTQDPLDRALERLRRLHVDQVQLTAAMTDAVRTARLNGATLRVIADAAGVSKDRVSKILSR